MSTDTPASLGYRLPAEWEPHAATWLAWPHKRGDVARQIRADPGGLGHAGEHAGQVRTGSRLRRRTGRDG